MKMPKVGAAHARLLAFVGDWEGEETVMPSPWAPGGPALGRLSFSAGLDGFAVLQGYVQERDNRVTFRGHGVFMIDPETEDVLWYWFDSVGFPPGEPARGRFEGDVLTLDRVTQRGSSRYVYEISEERCTFSIETKLANEPELKPMVMGRYRRMQ